MSGAELAWSCRSSFLCPSEIFVLSFVVLAIDLLDIIGPALFDAQLQRGPAHYIAPTHQQTGQQTGRPTRGSVDEPFESLPERS